jgi:hypothetical protein
MNCKLSAFSKEQGMLTNEKGGIQASKLVITE